MADTENTYPGSGYGNVYLDSLIWGGRWIRDSNDPPGVPLINYFFDDGFVPGYNINGLPWTSEAEKDALRAAVQLYENVANIQFQEVATYGEADIAWYQTSSADLQGDLGQHEPPSVDFFEPLFGFFNSEDVSWSNLTQGSFGFVTIIHELGHGLGLAHPHDGGHLDDRTLFPGVSAPFNDLGTFALNQGIWTTMSYNDGWNQAPAPSGELGYGYQGTPMAFDIAALQAIYGPNLTYHTGGDSYALPSVNAAGTFWSCIWDAGGTDNINAAGVGNACTINLNDAPLTGPNAGGFVSRIIGIIGGFTIANGVIIENATGGAGNDTLIGNEVANILDGGLGTDNMQGGAGDDTYKVNVASDLTTELAGAGTDTVESEVSYTLGANLENLVLIGAALAATGNTLANALTGNGADNTLDGKAGDDKMTGGLGKDVYFVDTTGDDVIETGSDSDEVRSSISLSKTFAGIERYTFIGAAAVNFAAGAADEIITGAAAADTLGGGGGNDTVDGAGGNDLLDGGAGIDSLKGGAGNDIYVVDDLADATDETGGSGIDTVQSSITFAIAATIENLTLTGADPIDGTGNALANTITGNGGANELFGLALNDTLNGGLGADTLDGGIGSDRMSGGADSDGYWVDVTTDIVTELAGGGTADLIKSSVTLTLGLEVENLELQGTANLNATGNTLANILVGNAGNNTLDGKAGVDTMRGGVGDDTYIVDGASEVVDEAGGSGTDTIKSSVSLDKSDLAADIENLILTGTASVGLGNVLDNVITGTTAGNTLTGRGGNDSLIGSSGNDTLTGDGDDDTMDGGIGADEFNPGAGNDVYVIDNIGDKIQPLPDDGTDTVESTITFTLVNQENLTLKGAGAINGTGNETGNIITGNGAANVLDGKSGLDTLIGGAGNDTYVVDAITDEVTEKDKEGIDLVKSSQSFTLTPFVENLTLTFGDPVNGTGNDLANVITGNTGVNGLFGLAGNDTLNGGDGNDTLDGGTGSDSMAGGLDDDLYLVDSATDKVAETSTAVSNDKVQSSESFTLGANLEDLELTGGKNVNGTGNTQNNLIVGNSVDNMLDGKTGNDTMRGGLGNDTYFVDSALDVFDEAGGGGIDTIVRPFTTVLDAVFENLTLTGAVAVDGTGNLANNTIIGNGAVNILTGDAGDDSLAGGAGNDSLVGGADNDTLDGGIGADAMDGGAGNDTFVVDSTSDKIFESTGTDTVKSSITYILGAGLEHLILTGVGAINGTGTDGEDNQLTGNDGANVLDGKTGNDTMAGGKGNDTFKVDAAGDVVMDTVNGGIDTVLSNASYALTDPNVENLTLNLGSLLAIAATGNGLANRLTGNEQANQLDGGIGVDTLTGGKGNDTYFVDEAKDVVTELAGADIDSVQSKAASYTLSANVEHLVLLAGAGSGTGNTLANTITGNGGNNSLDGGAGNDTLVGGDGDDLYVQDSATDLIDEQGAADSGDELKTNQVRSDVLTGIEHYTFTGSKAVDFDGDGAANRITGTALADTLTGGDGADTLDGGAGADGLSGGIGDDRYVVDNAGDKLNETTGGGTDSVQSSVTFDLHDDTPAGIGTVFGTFENLELIGTGAISGTGTDGDNLITGNAAANTLTGNGGDDALVGNGGNDTLDGGNGSDTITGGTGNDRANVGSGNDIVNYTSKLDGLDVIDNFDGDAAGGQDVLDLDGLFDSLGIGPGRAALVSITGTTSLTVKVDANQNASDGFELTVVTINRSNPADAVTVGEDIIVGT